MVPKIRKEKGIPHKDAMKACGELWGRIDDEEKKKYEDMNQKDKER